MITTFTPGLGHWVSGPSFNIEQQRLALVFRHVRDPQRVEMFVSIDVYCSEVFDSVRARPDIYQTR